MPCSSIKGGFFSFGMSNEAQRELYTKNKEITSSTIPVALFYTENYKSFDKSFNRANSKVACRIFRLDLSYNNLYEYNRNYAPVKGPDKYDNTKEYNGPYELDPVTVIPGILTFGFKDRWHIKLKMSTIEDNTEFFAQKITEESFNNFAIQRCDTNRSGGKRKSRKSKKNKKSKRKSANRRKTQKS
jgi:hypothetical protein